VFRVRILIRYSAGWPKWRDLQAIGSGRADSGSRSSVERVAVREGKQKLTSEEVKEKTT